jgi:type II secretory pathway component GspD/PulD (secretin)
VKTEILRGALALLACTAPAAAQVQESVGGVRLNFVDADVRSVLQLLSPYLDRPVLFGQLGGVRLSVQAHQPVSRGDLPGLLRSALAGQGLVMVEEGSSYAVRSASQGAPPAAAAPHYQGRPGGAELFVIRLRHARAADVAATVNALYGQASALGELGSRPSTLGGQLRDNREAAYGDQPAVQGLPQIAARSGRFEGDVAIVPDPRTNSLLIRASRGDFELIQAAVNQVDLRPLQVMIQVTIAEVRRNTEFSYALSAAIGAQPMRGSHNTTVEGSTIGAHRDGLRRDLEVLARGIGGVDLDLTLRAGVSRGAVSILSQPVIFATNNERAEILVGDQRPFVQLRRSNDTGVLDQVVQYKDVGTRLSVLPTISTDGYVQLQVTQEVNNAVRGTGDDAPIISTRTVETSLLVRDGQFAVLGGLAQAVRERGSTGIPYLSDIPIIGAIFGSRLRGSGDTELFIFLTPRVVRNDIQMDSLVSDVRQNNRASGTLSTKRPIVQPPPKRGGAESAPEAAPPGTGAPVQPEPPPVEPSRPPA